MSDKQQTIVSLVQLLCVIALTLTLRHASWERDQLRQEAIKRGFAEHNRVTGKWQWVEPKTNNES